MAEIKDSNYKPEKKQAKKVATGTIKEKSFKQKVRDAFISDEVHDIKSYVVFDVIIPAIKETVRNLFVNSLDMALFGKVRKTANTEQRGGSTYIAYDRLYQSRGSNDVQPRQQKGGAPLRVNELDRVVFKDKADAIDVLSYMMDNLEEYHVASIADFLSAADLPISPIHHKWGFYDLSTASVEELPDGSGFFIRLPRPVQI